jgi:uncharacterized protein YfaQ (DUF2300 family)
MILKKGLIALTFIVGFLQSEAQEQPRYIFINSAPGRHFSIARPATITREVFDIVTHRINAPANPKLRVGISAIFDYLSTNLDSVEKSLNRFLAISKETKVPVFIHLDG